MQNPTECSILSLDLVMAPKLSSMLSLIILLFLFLSPISSHATSSPSSNGEKPSPFGFIKGLQGCHKGDEVNGIQKLKKYLEQFGYLSYSRSKNQTHADDDDFDDLLESAIKTYQANYHLEATGDLDSETVSEMVKPRCGVADIINGTNWMLSGKKRQYHGHGHGSLRTVAHYSFFPRSPRWPPSKTYLTYAFLPGTPNWAMSPVSRAYGQWDSATHFTFGWIQDYTSSDMTISFHRLDHGDGSPFDGPGGIIAHAFAPTNGRFHYDGDETWSIGAVPNAMDLETVALHEIGHLLGLGHSSVQNAIMFPSISTGVTKGLHEDDIQGIRALYNR
ncbi:metalloendoproteinase 2-MMP-like [Vitis riparia]|uniref:metalloendoproteinase 2-MMP-like n=1 Tax=Vitis riparia TaxID=96939 RepID=UPI00155A61E7|nr:metalloendoproteinase 2-MMP-like [Vitis riparia]